jgi:hypothetical protein
MFLCNRYRDYGKPLHPVDAEMLGIETAGVVPEPSGQPCIADAFMTVEEAEAVAPGPAPRQ